MGLSFLATPRNPMGRLLLAEILVNGRRFTVGGGILSLFTVSRLRVGAIDGRGKTWEDAMAVGGGDERGYEMGKILNEACWNGSVLNKSSEGGYRNPKAKSRLAKDTAV